MDWGTREISPPGAELLQHITHNLTMAGHHLTITIFEDESVRIIARTIGQVVRIGLGVPW